MGPVTHQRCYANPRLVYESWILQLLQSNETKSTKLRCMVSLDLCVGITCGLVHCSSGPGIPRIGTYDGRLRDLAVQFTVLDGMGEWGAGCGGPPFEQSGVEPLGCDRRRLRDLLGHGCLSAVEGFLLGWLRTFTRVRCLCQTMRA